MIEHPFSGIEPSSLHQLAIDGSKLLPPNGYWKTGTGGPRLDPRP